MRTPNTFHTDWESCSECGRTDSVAVTVERSYLRRECDSCGATDNRRISHPETRPTPDHDFDADPRYTLPKPHEPAAIKDGLFHLVPPANEDGSRDIPCSTLDSIDDPDVQHMSRRHALQVHGYRPCPECCLTDPNAGDETGTDDTTTTDD